jgi:eukaryotic translation initiation factor 2-alpha kinase 4
MGPKKRTKDEPVGPTINYIEVQNEELEALGAIYADDFEQVETKSAWSKTSDRSFKLKIRPTLDDQSK